MMMSAMKTKNSLMGDMTENNWCRVLTTLGGSGRLSEVTFELRIEF